MKTRLIAFALASILCAPALGADRPKGVGSFTVGGVDADIALINEAQISGLNLKYQFEQENTGGIGFIGSFTYASGDDRIHQPLGPSSKIKSTYLSVALGPSYRLNRFASVYGMLGLAYGHAKVGRVSVNEHFAPVFGAGLRLNPFGRLVLDAHYEKAGVQSGRRHIDGELVSVGVGYSF